MHSFTTIVDDTIKKIKPSNAEDKYLDVNQAPLLLINFIKLYVVPLLIFGTLTMILIPVIQGLGKFEPGEEEAKAGVLKIFAATAVLIATTGYLTLWYSNKKREKKGEPPQTVLQFMSGANVSLKAILVGMFAGTVFGFIDNAGLYYGMDALDPLFKKMGATGELIKSGFGNTYSDMIGGFVGTFAGLTIQLMSGVSDVPIWSEAFGLVVGCLLGVFIPMKLKGKTWAD